MAARLLEISLTKLFTKVQKSIFYKVNKSLENDRKLKLISVSNITQTNIYFG